MPVWDQIATGVLCDKDITALAKDRILITTEFDADRVKQCCYEFTIGDTIIDLAAPEAQRKVKLDVGQTFIIRPRATIVAIVAEAIQVPPDCVVRFLLKGKYFAIGLAPVNTYADPGFVGRMGIVLTNVSNRYLKISRGDALAKAEFEKMPEEVKIPYHGQHGFDTGHWPVVAEYFANQPTLAEHGINPDSIESIRAVHGDAIAEMAERLRYYSRVVWIQIVVTIVAFALILNFADDLGWFWSVTLGVSTNIITTIAVNSSKKLRNKLLRPARLG